MDRHGDRAEGLNRLKGDYRQQLSPASAPRRRPSAPLMRTGGGGCGLAPAPASTSGAGGASISYTQKNGLAGDLVMVICPGANSNLWIGTETGLSSLGWKALPEFHHARGAFPQPHQCPV